jgi:acyl-CoA synthetase (AMP-forming)/AMP-acid ligase II
MQRAPVGGPNPFLDATASQMLGRAAARFPDRQAIVAADRRISYAEFLAEAERMARGLLAAGVGRDDKVALWLPNRPAWLFVQQACAMIGAVVVALNTRYKAHELAYILAQSDATTLILADHLGPIDFLETLGEVLPDLGDSEPGALDLAGFHLLKRVIVDADDPYPGCLRLGDVLEAGGEPEWQAALERARVKVTPDDPWTILYTSGTTSFPKGALITHRNAVPHGWYAGEALRVTEADRVHALPMTGTGAGQIPLRPSRRMPRGDGDLRRGRRPSFDGARGHHDLERGDAMAIAVLDHPIWRAAGVDAPHRRLRHAGGGRDGLFEDVLRRWACRRPISLTA